MGINENKLISENNLINDNIGLIKTIVDNFQPLTQDDFNEFIQLGRIGLLHAIRNHDPKRGKLSTIAWYYIYRELHRHIQKEKKHRHLTELTDFSQNFSQKTTLSLWDFCPFSLTDNDMQVLHARLAGYTMKEIGLIFFKSQFWASTQYQKIITKIKNANE